jgi:hypothetical protein
LKAKDVGGGSSSSIKNNLCQYESVRRKEEGQSIETCGR